MSYNFYRKEASKQDQLEIFDALTDDKEMINTLKTLAERLGIKSSELLQRMFDNFVSDVNITSEDLSDERCIPYALVGDAKERQQKLSQLRELFGLKRNEEVIVSEKQLVEKACELRKKTIQEITQKGRILAAKHEIGLALQQNLGKGKIGKADARIVDNLKYLIENNLPLSINRLVQIDNTFRPTVERFVNDNNLRGEGSNLDYKRVIEFLQKQAN